MARQIFYSVLIIALLGRIMVFFANRNDSENIGTPAVPIVPTDGLHTVDTDSPSSTSLPSDGDTTIDISRTECTEPTNPYNDTTPEYLGYEYAQEHDSESCSGQSSGFVMGCERYVSQESSYEACKGQGILTLN